MQNTKGFIPFIVLAILAVVLVVVGYFVVVLNWSYSDGERAGYLQKISRKGWVCKTYEGEMAMTTVPGVAPLLWKFTVHDDEVAKQMNNMLGKQIVLEYEEHRGLLTNCFGDTNYFVTKVREVKTQ